MEGPFNSLESAHEYVTLLREQVRGVRESIVEDIAGAVGINRAIIYRHFTGKEELFSLTLVQYLDELRLALEQAAATTTEPRDQLVRLVEAFVDYGLAHPAFVDCAQAIMRRPGGDLLEEVSESAMYRLGQAISGCLSVLTRKTLGGLETDLTGRVLGHDGHPVQGLYAAGEAAGFGGGGLHGYRSLEGTFLGGCIFSGRTAGRALAAATA